MFVFILRRLISTIPTLLGVALITFILLNVVGGDPVYQMVGKHATPQLIQELRHQYGFDQPKVLQFLAFLKQIDRAYPAAADGGGAGELHLVMDNYAAHKHPKIKTWLAGHPRIHVHFTPTHASWMNLVESWFSMAERQAIHRGTYTSVKDLNTKLRTYIDGWNDRAHPFTWTKTADQILAKTNRKKISSAEH